MLFVLHKNHSRKEAKGLQEKGNMFNDKLNFDSMHSRIFQISTEPISKENYLNEDTLEQGDFAPYDYCSEINAEQRRWNIKRLVNEVLPKGMFELTSEDTMRYNGGIEQWKEEYVANIRAKAEAINVDNMLSWNTRNELEKAIKNPLRTDNHFYLNGDGCQSFAEESFAFMDFVCSLEPDTILYIGGVIDYHF